jgi:hypothetical protein
MQLRRGREWLSYAMRRERACDVTGNAPPLISCFRDPRIQFRFPSSSSSIFRSNRNTFRLASKGVSCNQRLSLAWLAFASEIGRNMERESIVRERDT